VQILTHPRDTFEDKKILVQQVSDYLEPEYSPSHVVLDHNDYSKDNSVLEEFKHLAFQWNRNQPGDRVPAHVLDLMNDDLCFSLVWLSRKVLEEEEILFVWIVAHEFRHVYQAIKSLPFDALRQKSRELWRDAEFRCLPSSILGVAELDADICALQTARSIFGVELLSEFLQRRPLPRCPYSEYTLFLQRLEVACRDNEKQR
jgi:hypothetical protein